jgi:hypothetical protein
LRLRNYSAQLPGIRFDKRLPHHRRAAPMKGNAFADHRRTHWNTANEFSRRINGRGVRTLRKILKSTDCAKRVGERHDRPTMQSATGRTQICANHHGGDDSVFIRLL